MNENNPFKQPVIPPTPTAPVGTEPVSLKKPVPDANIKTLRTYEGDVAELLEKKKVNLATMAIAESKNQTGSEVISSSEELSSNTGQKILIVFLIILFIVGGVFGVYYLYMKSPLAPDPSQPNAPQATDFSIIPSDKVVYVDTDFKAPLDIVRSVTSIMNNPESPDTLKEIVFTKKTIDQATGKENLEKLSAEEMLSAIDLTPPDTVVRSLDKDWFFGIYTDMNGARNPVILTSTNFFQNTFSGMLTWERVMADDLKSFFNASVLDQAGAVQGKFEDRIIKNRDVREYIDNQGNVLFLYSFIDSTNLIFTNNEQVLASMIDRLDKNKYKR